RLLKTSAKQTEGRRDGGTEGQRDRGTERFSLRPSVSPSLHLFVPLSSLPPTAFEQLDLELLRQLVIAPHAHTGFAYVQSGRQCGVDLRQSGVVGISRRPNVNRVSPEASDLDPQFPTTCVRGQTLDKNCDESVASAARETTLNRHCVKDIADVNLG